MKICISATGATLESEVEPRFGRCPYFIIVDPETMAFEAMDNASAAQAGGAGIASAQSIAATPGIQAVLTGNCGTNAWQVLDSAGIKVITGVSGTVKNAIETYRAGASQPDSQANVPDHYGMNATPGTGGSGGGMGRGMGGGGGGMGRGRGMGRGMGAGGAMQPFSPASQQPQSPNREIDDLKAQAKSMAEQLASIRRRIEELEKSDN